MRSNGFGIGRLSDKQRSRLTRKYLKELGFFLSIVFAVAEDNGWSLRELAGKSGLGYSTVTKIRTGYTVFPQLLTVSKLVKAIGFGLEISDSGRAMRLVA